MNTETRSATGTVTIDDGRLVGYAAVFGKRSQDLGGFVEEIAPAAFNRTLSFRNDVVATFNHNVDQLLGRTAANTARVAVDDIGLRYEIDVPDTQIGRDVRTLAERGDLAGSSFTFAVTPAGYEWRQEDGVRVRTLNEVKLFELGPVTNPAYLDTTVAVRSLDEWIAEHNDDHDSEIDHVDIDADTDTREGAVSWRRPVSVFLPL